MKSHLVSLSLVWQSYNLISRLPGQLLVQADCIGFAIDSSFVLGFVAKCHVF